MTFLKLTLKLQVKVIEDFAEDKRYNTFYQPANAC